jgi:hypothetical protein
LPDITQANAPVIVSSDSCWCALNRMINENPVIALALLAGVAALILPKGGR